MTFRGRPDLRMKIVHQLDGMGLRILKDLGIKQNLLEMQGSRDTDREARPEKNFAVNPNDN